MAKDRLERFKKHKYSTPLPFDILAHPQSPATTATAQSSQKSSLDGVNGRSSDNSSSSVRSQASTNPTSTSDYSAASTDRPRSTPTAKHVPLHQLVDFRATHARQSKSQNSREPFPVRHQPPPEPLAIRRPPPADAHIQNLKPLPSEQQVVREGVPHLMTRESSVMVESVDGVPLTTTLNSHTNPGNHPTLPEFEAEEIREIETPTEADDRRLEAEFERYRRHYARPPPAVWHGQPHDDTAPQRMGGRRRGHETEEALWTKDGWRTRTRQISPRPANKGADHTFVDGYSNVNGVGTVQGKGKEDGSWPIRSTSLRRGSLERRAPSFRSDKSAAPLPTVTQRTR